MKISRCLLREVAVGLGVLFLLSGYMANQDWVKTIVNDRLLPVDKRISKKEAAITKVKDKVGNTDARVDGMAKQIADIESRLSETNAKADRALESLQRLKPER